MEKFTFCFTARNRMNGCGLDHAADWRQIDLDDLADIIRNTPTDAGKGDAGGILAPGYAWPFRPSAAGSAAAARLAAGDDRAAVSSQYGAKAVAEAERLLHLPAQSLFVVDVDIVTAHLTSKEAKEDYKAQHRKNRERIKQRLAAHPSCLFATLSHNGAWAIFKGMLTPETWPQLWQQLQDWIDQIIIRDAAFQPMDDKERYIVTDCDYTVDKAFFRNETQCRFIAPDPEPLINRGAVPLAIPTPKERADAFMKSTIRRIASAQTPPFRGLRTDPERMRRCPWVAVAVAAPAVVASRRIQMPDGGEHPTNILAALSAPSNFGKGAVLKFLPEVLRRCGAAVLEHSPKTNESIAAGVLEASGLRRIEKEIPSSFSAASDEKTEKTEKKKPLKKFVWEQVDEPRGLFISIDEAKAFLRNSRERKELPFLLQGFRLFWDGRFTVNRAAGKYAEMPDVMAVHGAALMASTASDELDFFRDGGDEDGNARRFLYFALSREDIGTAREGAIDEADRMARLGDALAPLLAMRTPSNPNETAEKLRFDTEAAVLLDLTALETAMLHRDGYRLHVAQIAAAEAQLNGRTLILPADVLAALWIVDGEEKSLAVIRDARENTAAAQFADDLRLFFEKRGGTATGKAITNWMTRRKDALPSELFRTLSYLEEGGFIACTDATPHAHAVCRNYAYGLDENSPQLSRPLSPVRREKPETTQKRKAVVLAAAATQSGLNTLADIVAAQCGLVRKTESADKITLGHEGSTNRTGGFQLALKDGRLVFTDFSADADGDAFNLADLLLNGHVTSARAPERMSAADFGRCLEWLERVLGVSAFAALEGGGER